MTGLGLPTRGRCSISRNIPWNEHCGRFENRRIRLCVPREFLKIIKFSVADLLSCSILATLSSMTLPKRINLQCGSNRLTSRVSVRPKVQLSASFVHALHFTSAHCGLDMPACLSCLQSERTQPVTRHC